jgi:ribonuclease III
MGLPEMLVLGKGVGANSVLPSSVGAAVLEAVIGAIFVDGGIEPAREFILAKMGPELEAATASQHQFNFKSLLQQHAQREFGAMPRYDVLDEKGPEHSKCFELAVRLGGRQFSSAWGKSKKEAEQKAALVALNELGVLSEQWVDADAVDSEDDEG